MKNIELIIPKLNQYYYEQKLENDAETMSYNAGYDVSYDGYHYNSGCIDFPKEKWKDTYIKRVTTKQYFAYIKDCTINRYVGYVNYQYNKDENMYECGVLIEHKYRGKGYAKDALKLLVKEAYKNGIDYLYDTFEKDREIALKTFTDVGFEIYKETTWKKFNKNVDGIIVRIKTNKCLPDTTTLKTIDDVLTFMKNNIRYGWVDINNEIHIGNMKNFRKLYRTSSITEILEYGIGTCIDQVKLMNYLLNKIGIKNKMFATRIYEPNDFNKLDEEEHMHCFILCYIDNKVYHIEHPNWYRIGIYEYESEEEALTNINDYYVKLSGGIPRPITEFYKIEDNLSFKEFNNYINNLNISFRELKDCSSDYSKLYTWCKNKNVYEWFEQRVLSYDEIVSKYKTKLMNNKQKIYIIKSNNKDIGLVQIYKFANDIHLDLGNYQNIYEYDLFIGEETYLNKGIGQNIVNNINKKIYEEYKADAIILRPFKRNIRAIKCYEKCDYKKIYEYKGSDTLENKEDIIVLLNNLDKWTFGIDTDKLVKLVLDGKKRATTSLYEVNNLSKIDDLSILTDSNKHNVCLVKTKKVIVTEFKNITWDLAKLEGENNSLEEWRKVHKDYFSKMNSTFNDDTKVIFEIFDVIEKFN